MTAAFRLLGSIVAMAALASYPCPASAELSSVEGGSVPSEIQQTADPSGSPSGSIEEAAPRDKSQARGHGNESLLKMKRQGKAMVISGAVLIPTGVVLAAVLLPLAFVSGIGHAFCEGDDCETTESFRRSQRTLIAFGMIGLAGMIPTGIIMIAMGKQKTRRAESLMSAGSDALVPEAAVSPTTSFNGAVVELKWHF